LYDEVTAYVKKLENQNKSQAKTAQEEFDVRHELKTIQNNERL